LREKGLGVGGDKRLILASSLAKIGKFFGKLTRNTKKAKINFLWNQGANFAVLL